MSHYAAHSSNLTTDIIRCFGINITIWRRICNSKEYTKRSPFVCALYPASSCLKRRILLLFIISEIIEYLAVTFCSESAFVILKYRRHILIHGHNKKLLHRSTTAFFTESSIQMYGFHSPSVKGRGFPTVTKIGML